MMVWKQRQVAAVDGDGSQDGMPVATTRARTTSAGLSGTTTAGTTSGIEGSEGAATVIGGELAAGGLSSG